MTMATRKQERLRNYVALISRSIGGLEALPERPLELPPTSPGALESLGATSDLSSEGRKSTKEEIVDSAIEGARKLSMGHELSDDEIASVEAIIIPDKRPAFDIIGGDFAVTHPLWTRLVDDTAIHDRL